MITETRFKYEFTLGDRLITTLADRRYTESEKHKYARMLGKGCQIVETLPKSSTQPFRVMKSTYL